MKKITVATYKLDPYYPRVVRAVDGILQHERFVSPVDVFIGLNLLLTEDLRKWRLGQIPYLERAIHCNLSKASRILRILRLYAHDLKLKPSYTAYMKWGKGKRTPLRFSKTGDPNIEEAYSRHFLVKFPLGN